MVALMASELMNVIIDMSPATDDGGRRSLRWGTLSGMDICPLQGVD